MKKIPIALASLSILGVANSILINSTYATAEDIPIVVQNSNDTLYMDANHYDPRFNLDYIMLTPSTMRFNVDFSATNQYVKRMVLVYYDYENGVTEAEADARLPRLGEEEYESWAVKVDDIDEMRAERSKTTILNTNLHARAIDGKTDLLYYAIEYGTKEVMPNGARKWSDTAWIRGKLDYRKCVHSEGVDLTKGPTCTVKVDPNSDQIALFVKGKPVDQNVISWPEEWREIQAERLDRLEKAIEELEELDQEASLTLELLEDESESLDQLFDSLGTTLPKTEGAEKMLEKLYDLGDRYDELWLKYDIDDEDPDDGDDEGDGDDEPGANTGDSDAEPGNKPSIPGSNNSNSSNNPGNSNNSSASNNSDNSNNFESSNNSTSSKNSENSKNNFGGQEVVAAKNKAVGSRVAYTVSNQNQAKMAENTENTENTPEVSQESSKISSDSNLKNNQKQDNEVDLPALGGENQWYRYLWLLVPVVGVLVMFVLWLKRRKEA